MIASRLHERTQPALTNFDRAVPEADQEAIRDMVKDPYILDFLADNPVRERDLSKALTDNPTRFLRELGYASRSSAPRSRSPFGHRELFVDLLFYHCRLHRYVMFEWKLGASSLSTSASLTSTSNSSTTTYVTKPATTRPLGLLLVVGPDDDTVEVALRGVSTPLAVTEWRVFPPRSARPSPPPKTSSPQ